MAAPVEPVTARDAFTITPSDTNVFPVMASALYVGTSGNINLRTSGGTTLVFTGLTGGSILPVRCDMVLSTSTTASTIVGLTY